MATEKRACLVPCSAAVVPEEGHGQRLGVMHRPFMSYAASSLMGVANSGMSQIHASPSSTGLDPASPTCHPAFPRARELGAGNHTPRPLSDAHKFAQAYVNHTKTDKFSY